MQLHEYETNDGLDTHKVGSVRLFGASITWRQSNTGGGEGWNCTAVLSGNMPEMPSVECNGSTEGGSMCYSRRRCDACYELQEWENEILGCVQRVTEWGLYEYQRGPGRPYAHGPSVYKRGSRIKVSWSGGLDI